MPLKITLDYDSGVPVYRQIVTAVQASLASGALGSDEQLPTIHELARRLGVNPNTVIRAYRELEQGGHVVAERGKGTFPARKKAPPSVDRILSQIIERALREAAEHGVSGTQLLAFFKKELS